MIFRKIFFSLLLLCALQQTTAQHNYQGSNFLGITVGAVFFDINTTDLSTKSETGFIFGFTTRGAFRNNFDLIYGITFQNSKLTVEGRNPSGTVSEIAYTIQGAQLNFLGSYNIIVKHLSLEFGPVVNINGKMKLDKKEFENYFLTGYESTTAKDIQDISMFDIRLAAGLTAGLEHFRLSFQYQYGLLNTLNGLNDKGLERENFKGNSATIVLSGIIYF